MKIKNQQVKFVEWSYYSAKRAFYSMNKHMRKEESSKMNNQWFHLRKLEKRGKFTPNRQKEDSDKN